MKNQYEILMDIQSHGHNVCTCGNCGDVVLFNNEMSQQEEIECPHCGSYMDYCDYPDLYSQADKNN